MSLINNEATFYCPKCGSIHKEYVKLHNTNLRNQSFSISPILPTCSLCGSEITLNICNIYNGNCKVIVLTGTCASGKSATAEMLMQQYGFEAIDGDCVMQVVKHKLGVNKIEYNESPMYGEIAQEIDILLELQIYNKSFEFFSN